MVISPASTVAAGHRGGETPAAGTGELLAQAVAGPGFWEDLLGELRRAGLIAELLADGVIAKAVAQAGHGHKLDRALTAEVTVMCVLVGALFPDQGYDLVLARTFAMPGLPVKPGTVTPSGPALSKARVLLGEQVMRRVFEIDAARTDADLGISAAWHEMETTAIDGTTIELFNCDELAEAFGVPAGGTKPKLRIAAHVRTASRRWISAAIGGYHDGENPLADELEDSFTAGILNLADRGFFSMNRWIRFSARGAHLVWRVKNGAKSVPFKTIKTLPDGSELVLLRESGSMLGKRRREHGDKTLTRLPDTIARLVSFTVTTRTARRARTSVIKVLTTLLDPEQFPAREIAALYAERWQIEIAYLHLKKTVKGTGRVLRGRSVTLARQEAWALLLVHNMTATLAARAAGQAGLDPDLIPFTAVLALIRGHVIADTCCPHCGKRPASGNDPITLLLSQILAQPVHRDRPERTSGRTALQRQNWHTEEVRYTITIVPSNLPKTEICPGS
ncbi:MAG TPA: IS4 family transposase [Streptosporangiaceae bacterium]|nr:IS4 family transposase [Streptosporangiaceae bacterium]